ncbi:hypothetical protein M8C21_005302 [Ambrosia artemisiifolia]|uniref:F-box/FBD/LRR-repeat protein n=1 Tax=Ambrosia artemisiifolia TaxID=4212 RepID=A0AAD5G612_AMBAR|nr:hypothetical protein M8C21_005302 [Ambrosia artemisiifolia]
MEDKRLSKAQQLSSDRITKLPQAIIETILCLLPIEEAARTSILSSEWRYKWTTIPKLVFRLSTVTKKTAKKKKNSGIANEDKLLNAIQQIIDEESLLGNEMPSIMDLFNCLPVIEHLTTWVYIFKAFAQVSVPDEPPASLIHLKYICIDFMCFVDGYGLPLLALLIKCSPNLEKIKLEIRGYADCDKIEPDELEEHSLILEKYSDVWLEHLYELEIEDFGNYKPELEFVKFILARSPNMKKVVLRICMSKNKELEMSKILLHTPRASLVEIIVNNRCKG